MESVVGRVCAVQEGVVTVIVDSPVTCHRCASGKGCGAGLLAAGQESKQIEIRIPAGMVLHTGEQVRLAIASADLLRAAFLAYGLPLVSMLVFIGAAAIFGNALSDLTGAIVAIAGLAAGIFAGRRILKRDAACDLLVPNIEGLAGSPNV